MKLETVETLDALKQQIVTDSEELDPQPAQWSQTAAAILGSTKKVTAADATLAKTFY